MSNNRTPDDLNQRGYKPQPSKPKPDTSQPGGTAGYTPPPIVDNITKPPRKL
ncbi:MULTISPECIES: hypothetical protein [Acinetobacter]|jgi:hypothetical protein|uniref:hypothetical protein n=1 Tax=Acinetobacter TaxID=469 RepID=UPI00287EF6CA|nr:MULTISPECIES: hypothetical protein [Acinetobacter]MDS7924563.1 hypothetical protein [Acinetobacter sp. V115_6]WQF72731.1 hypothetical protein OKW95_18220 [Acinetobacter oleivorans]